MFKVKAYEVKIRMLGCSSGTRWSMSVCPWLSLHQFLFAMEHLTLTPSGVQRPPVFHSTKIFVFRKGVTIGLGALSLTSLESLAYIYWGQRTGLVGEEDSPQVAHGGDIQENRERLLYSQHWCWGSGSQWVFWTSNVNFTWDIVKDAGSQPHLLNQKLGAGHQLPRVCYQHAG